MKKINTLPALDTVFVTPSSHVAVIVMVILPKPSTIPVDWMAPEPAGARVAMFPV